MRCAKAASSKQLPNSVAILIDNAHRQGKTVVLVTGVFDVLHEEHRNFLQKAKRVGDVLIVGLESDYRVGLLKGANRPVNREKERLHNLTAWDIADAVFVLPDRFSDQQDYLNLLETICPHVLAVSSNTPYVNRKRKLMELVGGEVKVVHKHNPGVSTTQLLQAQSAQ